MSKRHIECVCVNGIENIGIFHFCSCLRINGNQRKPRSTTSERLVNSSKWLMTHIWPTEISCADILRITDAYGKTLCPYTLNWCHSFMVKYKIHALNANNNIYLQLEIFSPHLRRLFSIWDNHKFTRCWNTFDPHVGCNYLRITGKPWRAIFFAPTAVLCAWRNILLLYWSSLCFVIKISIFLIENNWIVNVSVCSICNICNLVVACSH